MEATRPNTTRPARQPVSPRAPRPNESDVLREEGIGSQPMVPLDPARRNLDRSRQARRLVPAQLVAELRGVGLGSLLRKVSSAACDSLSHPLRRHSRTRPGDGSTSVPRRLFYSGTANQATAPGVNGDRAPWRRCEMRSTAPAWRSIR